MTMLISISESHAFNTDDTFFYPSKDSGSSSLAGSIVLLDIFGKAVLLPRETMGYIKFQKVTKCVPFLNTIHFIEVYIFLVETNQFPNMHSY